MKILNLKYNQFVFLVILIPLMSFVQEGTGSEEYNVKTALIYNFTKYTKWEKLPEQEFIIGVWGESPITNHLNRLVSKNKIQTRKAVVKKINNLQEIRETQILFIPENVPEKTISEILGKYSDKNILIIGEKKGLAAKGVSLNFLEVGGRIKFEANREAINKSNLEISSELLKHAVIVK